MKNQFFNGYMARAFNPFFQRPRRNNRVQKRTKKVKRNNNRPRKTMTTSNIQTFRLYRGTLDKKGLIVPLGPDSSVYAGTQYFLTSRNFNNYKVISAQLEFTPLLNATTAQSMINAYLTTDVNATLSTTDVAMKQNTISHNGQEWFAGNRRVCSFRIPTMKQNTYETGSGEYNEAGTSYENCANIMVMPTSLNDDIKVGEIYLKITVAFTAPAAPYLTTTRMINNTTGIADGEVIVDKQDHNMLKAIFYSGTFDVLCPDVGQQPDPLYYRSKVTDTEQDKAWEALEDMIVDGSIAFYKTAAHNNYEWNADTSEWVPVAAFLQPVEVVNNVVPSITPQLISQLARILQLSSDAPSMPVHNSVTDDTDITDVNVTNDKEHAVPTLVINSDSEQIPVQVKNDKISVEVVNEVLVDIANQPVSVDIANQPIDVHEQKSAGDDILGILGTVITAIV